MDCRSPPRLPASYHCSRITFLTGNNLCSTNHVDAGGKPSTWFPPEGLVEQRLAAQELEQEQEQAQRQEQEQAQKQGQASKNKQERKQAQASKQTNTKKKRRKQQRKQEKTTRASKASKSKQTRERTNRRTSPWNQKPKCNLNFIDRLE